MFTRFNGEYINAVEYKGLRSTLYFLSVSYSGIELSIHQDYVFEKEVTGLDVVRSLQMTDE